MKHYNALVDDNGQRWEFLYEEEIHYRADDDGNLVSPLVVLPSTITNLTYRREGDPDYLPFPPWADIQEGWKITLGFFDEDDDTGELTYWKIETAAAAHA